MARALYIHWPYCLQKCPYCDFNSHVRDTVDVPRWRNALFAELDPDEKHRISHRADAFAKLVADQFAQD